MLIIIADDITGAAETAGTVLRHGLKAVLTIGPTETPQGADAWVIATDTRSQSEACAVNTVRTIAGRLKGYGRGNMIFKKTDSVLRGHVKAELLALMEETGYRQALLIPQNPTKGRIIRNGRYYVDGRPLDETAFSYDPEYPARTSSVKELLNDEHVSIMTLADSPDPMGEDIRIYIAEAASYNEMRTQAEKAGAGIMPAGGADFLDVLLCMSHTARPTDTKSKRIRLPERTIIVCGSTQSEDLTDRPFVTRTGAYVATMPTDVFNGAPPDEWIASVAQAYASRKSAVITIGKQENKGAGYAVRLKGIMAEAVRRSVEASLPEMIIIEGGATAFAVIQALGWNTFGIKSEYAPGIVGMTHGKTEIILKPGSYPWGENFEN